MPRRPRARGPVVVARCAVAFAVMTSAACTHAAAPSAGGPAPNAKATAVVRVSLGVTPAAMITAAGSWRLLDRDNGAAAQGAAGEGLSLTSAGGLIRVVDARGTTRELASPLSLVVQTPGGTVSLNQRRYRG